MDSHSSHISLAVISSMHCFVNMKSSFCVCKLLYISFICHSSCVCYLPTNMSVTAGAKIQEELNNIPLADDDPQGELLILNL